MMNILKHFKHVFKQLFDETSHKCFYSGQLCLNTCLIKLKHLFYSYYKQEQKLSSTIITNKSNTKQHNELINSLDLDSPHGINHNNKNLNKIIDQSLLFTRTNDSPIKNGPTIRTKSRTCGARFAGGTLLICFWSNIKYSTTTITYFRSADNERWINRSTITISYAID